MDGTAGRAPFEAEDEQAEPLPDRIRLPLDFDVEALTADLAAFGEQDWFAHIVKQNYEGAWRIVPLRGPAGEKHPIRMVYPNPGAMHFEDTPYMDRALHIGEALARLPCRLRSVRLMSLSPGSTIKEHCDSALDAESGAVRLHVPIVTNPDVEFLLNRRAIAMEPGSCWYLRLTDPHQVTNRGATDRVHLVIDADLDEWLDGMLRAGLTE